MPLCLRPQPSCHASLKFACYSNLPNGDISKCQIWRSLVPAWLWLTFTILQWMKINSKISQFSRSLLRSKYTIQVKIWKWLKLLNSVPFIKRTLVNHVYIWIWSFYLTFTALQWMKTNFKNSQFSSLLLMSSYAIYFKVW